MTDKQAVAMAFIEDIARKGMEHAVRDHTTDDFT